MAESDDRISIDAQVMVGKPVIKSTRLTVEQILDLLKRGWTREQIFHEYPGISDDDVVACEAHASRTDEPATGL